MRLRIARPTPRARASALLVLVALLVMALPPVRLQVAFAASFSVGCGDVVGLIAAINAANTNGQADTIDLAAGCTYTLTTVNNNGTNGPNGLPIITSGMTINGNGATIARSNAAGTPQFRLIEIASGAIVSLNALQIANGNSSGGGGGILNAGNLTISGSTVAGNRGSGGGGITSFGALTVTTSTFSSNSAGSGGGIYASGTVTISRSTFNGNATVSNDGGAIFAGNGVVMSITNSTFSANSAVATGGALVTSAGTGTAPTVTITNSTFSGNSARIGGGVITVFTGSVTLQNSIVANSPSGGNCVGVTSAGNNLSSDGSCGGGPSDTVGTPPQLGPLANNGGPTFTHLPAPGSPAIDASNNATCPAADQRGVARPSGPACDIGAVEVTPQTGPTFTVTNNGDAAGVCEFGACSLRAAIAAANAKPNGAQPDTISFGIGSGTQTISPTTALPAISDPAIVDATTQPGFAGAPLIVLDGRGTVASGLTITAGSSTLRGLAIGNFSSEGLLLQTGGNNRIEGNYIGTNASGTAARANRFFGVSIQNSPNNIIGGTSPAARNVISGNSFDGIVVQGAAATGNVIQGNYIGTSADGLAPIANAANGIGVQSSNTTIGGTAPGARNVVSGNVNAGIAYEVRGTANNTVQGNYIGVGSDGITPIGNRIGVDLFTDLGRSLVGGTAPGAGNLIAFNTQAGVRLTGSLNNTIQGNMIRNNGAYGVSISSANNTVGGLTPAARNIIGQNGAGGVLLQGVGASGNRVQGNAIGTDASGGAALGNAGDGVQISGASSNTIGGADGAANLIAYNGGRGVNVVSGAGNRIQDNAIFANSSLGIDLGNDGRTANDSGDPDTGANNLQNFPVITATIDTAGSLVVQYRVDSAATAAAYPLQVQLFRADSAASGQGRAFLGVATLSGPGAGSVNLGTAAAAGVTAGDPLVATATDSNGNTSEFSAVANVTAPPPPQSRLIISAPFYPATSAPFGAPPFAVARTPFDITVTALDASGAVVTSFSDPVTVTIRSGTGAISTTLSGATTVRAAGGIVRLSGLTIATAGRGYQLLASTPRLLTAIGAPFDVLEPEAEPNGTIEDASPLGLDAAGRTARAGWVATDDDADLFVLNTPRSGATIAISLTNLPADYDLALLSDPRNPIQSSDGISLTNITDAGKVDPAGRALALTRSDSLVRINALAGQLNAAGSHIDLASHVLALSTNRSASETITATLGPSGSYYVLVYSAAGGSDIVRPYRLDLSLRGGTPPALPPGVEAVPSLNLTPSGDVRTIFLYNSTRMRDRYTRPITEAAAIDKLVATLTDPSSKLMQVGSGVSIDLSGARQQLPDGTAAALGALYRAWDQPANHFQASYANQVAQQIWNVLDTAISRYYQGTTDIVLVGGDDIIPFYRVPDETAISPESDYYRQLLTTNALSTTSPLAGSLGGNFIQTDDFYADREPTPWRGRALYVPDLGTGRLVERPTDIVRYLDTYAGSDYTIAADQTADPASGRKAGAVLVTGYDYVTDEASEIRNRLVQFGFPDRGRDTAMLGVTYTLNLLNDNSWTSADLTRLWFSGPASRYQLTSLNGHFSHYALEPADRSAGVLDASQLMSPSGSYFANSLIYSVGCHTGLNAPDTAFAGPNAARLRADFPAAILQQGGNWIGNTGFAYGDKQAIGYSEQLALLFTEQVGRKVMAAGAYKGAPIGESLAQAKQRYLRRSGSGGFSVSDEKTITQMTLYGLPFMRLRVPKPVTPPYGDSFDPPPQPFPDSQLQNNGLLTRLITITNEFSSTLASDSGQVPVVISRISDTFTSTVTVLTGTSQMAPGRPVLPVLSYGITLQANPTPCAQNCGIPQPRGVRLRSATTLPDLYGFRPHITRPITEQVFGALQTDPAMTVLGTWLPDLPYTFQRTADLRGQSRNYVDRLIVSPAQFNASDSRSGVLRRFSRMVFEVSYVDPNRAGPAIVLCFLWWCSSQDNSGGGGGGGLANLAAGALVPIHTDVTYKSAVGMPKVSATYTIDGINWQRQPLAQAAILNRRPDGTVTARYMGSLPAPPPTGNISVFFESIDGAGNVSVSTLKGANGLFTKQFLPIAAHAAFPDLVGSISLSPDKHTFAAGEPVQITATITNTGNGDAGPFWVDLFINPSTPPTVANVTWNSVCRMNPCFGLTWQVSGGLKAHQIVTLTSTSLPPRYSVWPGWFAAGTTDLYVYVDSWNPGVSTGAVLESNESNNAAHQGGLTVTGKNPPFVGAQSAERLPARPAP